MQRPKTSKKPKALQRSQSTNTIGIKQTERAETANDRLTTASSNELEVPTDLRNLYDLVMQYSSLGQYDLAGPLCRQAIDEFRKHYGDNHIHVATLYNVYGTILHCQRRYKEAASALNSALLIRETHFSKDHPIILKNINKLAYLYAKQKKLSEADEFNKRGIEVRGHAIEMNDKQAEISRVRSAGDQYSQRLREKYFNLIVSKSSQIARNKTYLSTSNKYLFNKIQTN